VIFWIIVIALLAVALAFILLPMLRVERSASDDQRVEQNIQIAREQKAQLDAQLESGELDRDAYERALLDLETGLAIELEQTERGGDRSRGAWMTVVVLLAIPLVSVSMYFAFGNYPVVEDPSLAEAPRQQTDPHQNIDGMIATIEERLQAQPDDANGWYALGQAYGIKRQFDRAETAYRKTYELVGDQPEVLFSLADAIAMQNNGSLLGEPEQLVARGLELAPRYPNGLWLAGLIAQERGDYRSAHRYWSLLLPLIADNASATAEVRRILAALEANDPQLAAASEAPSGSGISLTVDISPELKARARPDQAVFIYAKAMQGPPMPLAVRRMRVADLPVSVTLSDADAMMPSMTLSSFPQVVVGARVSSTGTANAQPGDFYTEREGIDSASPPEQLSLTIDQVRQ
jgi:cytochrome c-type biogenesis protein CcmH